MKLRCRIGLHRRVLRWDDEAVRAFLVAGVNLMECADCGHGVLDQQQASE